MSVHLSPFWSSVVRAAITGFVGAVIPLASGIWTAPNWDAQKAVAVSALVAGVSAAARAAWAVLNKNESPFPGKGI